MTKLPERLAPLAWAACIFAAGALAAVTTVRPTLHDTVVAHSRPASFFGGDPNLFIRASDDTADTTLVFVTRWRSDMLMSQARASDLIDQDGNYDLSLLMTQVSESRSSLGADILDRLPSSDNSAIVVRDHATRTDEIYAFEQMGVLGSDAVTMTPSYWNGAEGWVHRPTHRPTRGTIVFLGGSEGGTDYVFLRLWAALGLHVVSVPWVGGATQTHGCLDRIDLDAVQSHVEDLYLTHEPDGPVSLVGFSAGADAALMIAHRSRTPWNSVHAVSPTAWHFNGAKGPACMIASSPWLIDRQPVPYILNFPLRLSTPLDVLRRAAGGLSQRTLADQALFALDEQASNRIVYPVSDIDVPTFLYAGGLDELTPSGPSLDRLCPQIRGVTCRLFSLAGHEVLGSPTGRAFCDLPTEALRGVSRSRYCLATASARAQVFHAIADVAGRSADEAS